MFIEFASHVCLALGQAEVATQAEVGVDTEVGVAVEVLFF